MAKGILKGVWGARWGVSLCEHRFVTLARLVSQSVTNDTVGPAEALRCRRLHVGCRVGYVITELIALSDDNDRFVDDGSRGL